ncbi:MAG: peptidyl-prolyl cis-trans isomerase [Neisseriaceae bacterium]|nr:peptidyl-prolyl cis-trans isomerase [Neisseriaceae bacterium]MBR5675273.1 peptidyl-prolyl cis-trans isomerase [Neisseriaceae bacterium]
MKKTLLAIALMAGMAGVSAKTVVTVNGTKIDSAMIDRQVSDLNKQSKGQIKDSPELRERLKQNAIVHTVIVQEAKKRKLDDSAEYKDFIKRTKDEADKRGESKKASFKQDFEDFKENLLEQAFAADVLKKNPVTEQDVRKEYNQINDFYKGSQEVQIAEIVTKTKADAEKVLAELKKGKKFADVAKAHTVDEVGKKNGGMHQGYINLKDMEVGAPPLHAAIKDLKKGDFTKEPMQGSNNVWAIFSVQDKRTAKVPTFEQMKEALTAQLEGQRVDQAVADLLKKASIK